VVLPAEIVFVAYLGVPDIDQSGDNFRRGHEAQALALCAERVRLCAVSACSIRADCSPALRVSPT
jgi:hypothetical protein